MQLLATESRARSLQGDLDTQITSNQEIQVQVIIVLFFCAFSQHLLPLAIFCLTFAEQQRYDTVIISGDVSCCPKDRACHQNLRESVFFGENKGPGEVISCFFSSHHFCRSAVEAAKTQSALKVESPMRVKVSCWCVILLSFNRFTPRPHQPHL